MKVTKLRQLGMETVNVGPLKSDPKVIDEITIGDWFHLECMDQADKDGRAFYYLGLADRYFDLFVDASGNVELVEKA